MIRRSIGALLAATLLFALVVGQVAAARPVFAFSTVLTGEAEAPGPGDADAIGHATVLIWPDTDTICWVVNWTKVDGTVFMAHIHGPAPVGVPAGIKVVLFMDQSFAGTGVNRGCTESAEADLIVANPQLYYVNVHSLPNFGPGAIRGQLS
ncbi:MAG TPA: CHRD domain-containing protein [Candidatus Limnocylindria bacterium]|nr:CHRD domain-containing protein [Candidatus Limnocylindria bacterium]